jgi:hypothetical protein
MQGLKDELLIHLLLLEEDEERKVRGNVLHVAIPIRF